MADNIDILLPKLQNTNNKLKWLSSTLLLVTLTNLCIVLFFLNNDFGNSQYITILSISIICIVFIIGFFFDKLSKEGKYDYDELVSSMHALSLGDDIEIQNLKNKANLIATEFVNRRNIPLIPRKYGSGFMILINTLIIVLWVALNLCQNAVNPVPVEGTSDPQSQSTILHPNESSMGKN